MTLEINLKKGLLGAVLSGVSYFKEKISRFKSMLCFLLAILFEGYLLEMFNSNLKWDIDVDQERLNDALFGENNNEVNKDTKRKTIPKKKIINSDGSNKNILTSVEIDGLATSKPKKSKRKREYGTFDNVNVKKESRVDTPNMRQQESLIVNDNDIVEQNVRRLIKNTGNSKKVKKKKNLETEFIDNTSITSKDRVICPMKMESSKEVHESKKRKRKSKLINVTVEDKQLQVVDCKDKNKSSKTLEPQGSIKNTVVQQSNSELIDVTSKDKQSQVVDCKDKNENSIKIVQPQGSIKNTVSQQSESADTIEKYKKFQRKLSKKLEGGQFRWINEKLYTSESEEALKMFSKEPKLFEIYHKGFESQVQHWPENPVDLMIRHIKERTTVVVLKGLGSVQRAWQIKKDKPVRLRIILAKWERDPLLVVADFGCGDAKIAQAVRNKVHSFDFLGVNDYVTVCDMKKVPLPNNSVDIAIFCLSLMGTNLVDFLVEAKRVLKPRGTLKIAEVKSRFVDVDQFVKDIELVGYTLRDMVDSNKMFVMLEFENTVEQSFCQPKNKLKINLNPCIYKKR